MVDGLVREESIAEVRHLDDDWLLVERQKACSINRVLIGARDEALLRLDVVREHAHVSDGRDGQDAAEAAWSGHPRERGAAMELVDERPSPHVRNARDRTDVLVRHSRVGYGAWNELRDRRLR